MFWFTEMPFPRGNKSRAPLDWRPRVTSCVHRPLVLADAEHERCKAAAALRQADHREDTESTPDETFSLRGFARLPLKRPGGLEGDLVDLDRAGLRDRWIQFPRLLYVGVLQRTVRPSLGLRRDVSSTSWRLMPCHAMFLRVVSRCGLAVSCFVVSPMAIFARSCALSPCRCHGVVSRLLAPVTWRGREFSNPSRRCSALRNASVVLPRVSHVRLWACFRRRTPP